MTFDFSVRLATVDDAPVLARHRAEMFHDMGEVPACAYDALVAASRAFFVETIAAGTYWGWLAVEASGERQVVGGVGLLLRERLPRPDPASGGVAARADGYVLNVFTERAWRRRGVARRLMEELIAWAQTRDFGRLTLHASVAGRGLYEQLGFTLTNEMQLVLRAKVGKAGG